MAFISTSERINRYISVIPHFSMSVWDGKGYGMYSLQRLLIGILGE